MDGTVEEQLDREKLRSFAAQRVGDELEGTWSLQTLIGLGKMGAVYRAEGPDGATVAVKVMHDHIHSNEEVRERFLREAEILGRVEHPNAVELYGTGTTETGSEYFAMEFLRGEEVRAILDQAGTFSPVDALDLGEQVAAGLSAYHGEGILHRDIKPSNLFVTTGGRVKLLDFSVARYRKPGETPTRDGTMLGTPAYMAPEQSLGRQSEIDERTDVFGLGAVLYELLSGETVYDIESVQTALVQAATAQIPPLERVAPDVPEKVARIVNRAISRERENRFQSAAQMRDAIREILEVDESEGSTRDDTGGDRPSIVVEAEQLEELIGDSEGANESGPNPDVPDDLTPVLLEAVRAVRARPESVDFESDVSESLRTLLRGASEEGLVWSVGPYWFETDGGEFHKLEGELKDVPAALQHDGFYRLAVDTEVTRAELQEFVRWLGADPVRSMAGEDDLATRFRMCDFSSIGAGICENFRWRERGELRPSVRDRHRRRYRNLIAYSCGPEGAWTELEILEAFEEGASGSSAAAGGGREGLQRRIDSRASDYLRKPKGLLSNEAASALMKATESNADQLKGARAAIVARIWERLEPTEQLRESTRAHLRGTLEATGARRATEFVVQTARNFERDETRDSFLRAMLDRSNFRRIFEEIDADSPGSGQRRAYAQTLRELADALPPAIRHALLDEVEVAEDLARYVLVRDGERPGEPASRERESSATQTQIGQGEASSPEAETARVDARRAYAGELYRLLEACRDASNGDFSSGEPVGEFHRRLEKVFAIEDAPFSLLFDRYQSLVNGIPLEGSPRSHRALGEIRSVLSEHGCNEIAIAPGISADGAEALARLLRRFEEGKLQEGPPFEPAPNVRIDRTDPAEAFGIVDPLIGDRPLEARIGAYYAACATTLERYVEAAPSEKADWFSGLKRMSQVWTRLCARSRSATLAVLGFREEQSSATKALDGVLLALLMARRLTRNKRALRGIAYAGFAVPVGRLDSKPDERLDVVPWASPEQAAAEVLRSADATPDATWRITAVYETALVEAGREFDDFPYGEGTSPKVESVILAAARTFARRFADTEKDGAAARRIIERMSGGSALRVERYALHLLADTLGLFTRGMPVELSSGWRGTVVHAGSSLTEFHLPVVRLKRSPSGDRIEPITVDLADVAHSGTEYGHVVRRIEGGELYEESDVRDSLMDSLQG